MSKPKLITPRAPPQDWSKTERIIVQKPTRYLSLEDQSKTEIEGIESMLEWLNSQPTPQQLQYLKDMDFEKAQRYQQYPVSRQTVKSTSRVIPPLPEQCLIQFIGGAFNGDQKYFPYSRLNDGDVQIFRSEEYLLKGVLRSDEYRYRLTQIPMDQTPFSDAQIVIGIFQP